MKAHLGSLFDRYRAHHDMDRPLLQWIGIVGCIAFPLFYVLRRAAGAPGYDDLQLRLVAAVLCLLLALRQWWPARLRPLYIGYSYLVVFYSLSFLLSYTMLRNHGGTPAVVNMVIGAVLIILLADWRNTIAMLLGGYALALVAAWLTDPDMRVPQEFVFAAAGSILIVVGGALSHQNQKRAEIQRMRRLYTSLAGSIAHEMRNPLAQLRHALDSIATALPPSAGAQPAQLTAADLTGVLAIIQQGRQAVMRGQQAIDLTLQQLQQAATDRGRFRTLSAQHCLRTAVDAFAYEDAGQRSHVRIVGDADFEFEGEPTAIELVLFNLLKNALYYLPLRPDMQVTLTVACEPVPCIVVQDTGPGIPADVMPRLFREFETVGKQEGTGLGLAFCRRVMQELGGGIACRSEPGVFTEFTLTFPAAGAASAQRHAAAPASPPPPAGSLRGRTVLAIDDQALNRAIARSVSAELGLEVIEAETGHRALDLLQSGTLPDVILMDVNMPGLNGIETTRAIRALGGPAAAIPVVAVTANNAPAVLDAAREAGVRAVLTKPIDRDLLAQTLHQLLAAGAAAAAPVPSPLPTPTPAGLLNQRRLQDLRRLGLLEEMLPDALRDLRRLCGDLAREAKAGNVERAKETLHSLLGISGEAGAQALHAQARRDYEALLQGRFPDDPAWADHLRSQLEAAEAALLRDHGVRASGSGPEDPQTSSHSLRV